MLFTVHVVKNVQVTSKLSPQNHFITKIVSEYDQEIPQLQTADNPVAPRGTYIVFKTISTIIVLR